MLNHEVKASVNTEADIAEKVVIDTEILVRLDRLTKWNPLLLSVPFAECVDVFFIHNLLSDDCRWTTWTIGEFDAVLANMWFNPFVCLR